MENVTSCVRSGIERINEISNTGHNGDISCNIQSFQWDRSILLFSKWYDCDEIINTYFRGRDFKCGLGNLGWESDEEKQSRKVCRKSGTSHYLGLNSLKV